MKTVNIFFFLVMIISVHAGCKKSDKIKPLVDGPIGAQTLAETKNTFKGTWKLHHSIGGYSGTVRVNFPNTLLTFTSSDSLYRWDNNFQTIKSKVNYVYSNVFISDYATFVLVIEYPNNLMLSHQIAYKMKGDTLILGQPTTQPDYLYLTKN